MGRFGNVLLVNGEPRWDTRAARGEVVRFFLTNVSSTRVFNVSFHAGAQAASRFPRPDEGRRVRPQPLRARGMGREHHHRAGRALRGRCPLRRRPETSRSSTACARSTTSRRNSSTRPRCLASCTCRRDARGPGPSARVRAAPPQRSESSPRSIGTGGTSTGPWTTSWSITLQAGDLPFPLGPLMNFESVYRNPVEWSGTMPEMDWIVTGENARWLLRDARHRTREHGHRLALSRRRSSSSCGSSTIAAALHAMQHPIHIHGQRFLVALGERRAERRIWCGRTRCSCRPAS